jgi:ABC-2 type transport system ATP-binding protein
MNGLGFQIENLVKKFPNVTALDGPSLELAPGLIHGLIGPEGAGKTTLMRCLMNLMTITSGKISVIDEGVEVPLKSVKQGIGYFPQGQSLYHDLTVGEHLDFFARLYGLPKKQKNERSEKLLHIARLEPFVSRPAGKLSGGMYKKLGLICALLATPKAVLLDEPTNGVDPIGRRELWDLLYQMREEGLTVLLSTAYMDEAERCDRSHLLQDGILLESGPPDTLMKKNGVSSISELFIRKTSGGAQ